MTTPSDVSRCISLLSVTKKSLTYTVSLLCTQDGAKSCNKHKRVLGPHAEANRRGIALKLSWLFHRMTVYRLSITPSINSGKTVQ